MAEERARERDIKKAMKAGLQYRWENFDPTSWGILESDLPDPDFDLDLKNELQNQLTSLQSRRDYASIVLNQLNFIQSHGDCLLSLLDGTSKKKPQPHDVVDFNNFNSNTLLSWDMTTHEHHLALVTLILNDELISGAILKREAEDLFLDTGADWKEIFCLYLNKHRMNIYSVTLKPSNFDDHMNIVNFDRYPNKNYDESRLYSFLKLQRNIRQHQRQKMEESRFLDCLFMNVGTSEEFLQKVDPLPKVNAFLLFLQHWILPKDDIHLYLNVNFGRFKSRNVRNFVSIMLIYLDFFFSIRPSSELKSRLKKLFICVYNRLEFDDIPVDGSSFVRKMLALIPGELPTPDDTSNLLQQYDKPMDTLSSELADMET